MWKRNRPSAVRLAVEKGAQEQGCSSCDPCRMSPASCGRMDWRKPIMSAAGVGDRGVHPASHPSRDDSKSQGKDRAVAGRGWPSLNLSDLAKSGRHEALTAAAAAAVAAVWPLGCAVLGRRSCRPPSAGCIVESIRSRALNGRPRAVLGNSGPAPASAAAPCSAPAASPSSPSWEPVNLSELVGSRLAAAAARSEPATASVCCRPREVWGRSQWVPCAVER